MPGRGPYRSEITCWPGGTINRLDEFQYPPSRRSMMTMTMMSADICLLLLLFVFFSVNSSRRMPSSSRPADIRVKRRARRVIRVVWDMPLSVLCCYKSSGKRAVFFFFKELTRGSCWTAVVGLVLRGGRLNSNCPRTRPSIIPSQKAKAGRLSFSSTGQLTLPSLSSVNAKYNTRPSYLQPSAPSQSRLL